MSESVRHRLVRLGALVLLAGLLSACIVGSDEDADPTSTTAASPTATTRIAPTATATVTPRPTSTPVPPTPTRTPTPRPTATATPIPKVPLGTITPLDPNVVGNYSLSAEIELRGVPDQTDFVASLLILQAAPDHYYLRSTSGGAGIESWLVDGTTYLTQADGSVAKLPKGTDTALFSPALLIQTIPTVSGDTVGVVVGTDDVSGRQATHYVIDAEDLFDTASWLPRNRAENINGQVEVWIDNELKIILRQVAEVHWENRDGSQGSYVSNYEVTNVTTTQPVTAPG